MSPTVRDDFLGGRRVAVLVTIAEDGTPVPTPIWYLYRQGSFYFRTSRHAEKTKNVQRDPRVSLCVQDERPPYKSVNAYGVAEIREEMESLGRAMPRHYLGFIGGIAYRMGARSGIERGDEVTLVMRPTRFTTTDFSTETPRVGGWWLFARRFLPPWL